MSSADTFFLVGSEMVVVVVVVCLLATFASGGLFYVNFNVPLHAPPLALQYCNKASTCNLTQPPLPVFLETTRSFYGIPFSFDSSAQIAKGSFLSAYG
jgi:hypothetical protein